MFTNRTRSLTITLLALSLSLLATSANARGEETPWMVQVVLESQPDGFKVMETTLTDCEARDWKAAGTGLTVSFAGLTSGPAFVGSESGPALSYQMRDPRLVFVESPDGSRWRNEELQPSGDALMFPIAYHVLSFPLAPGEMPALPLVMQFTDEAGKVVLETSVDPDHFVPGDVHGCQQPELVENHRLGP